MRQSEVRDAVDGEAWRLLGDNRLQSPPTRRDGRGRISRADHGEWDSWYELPQWERTYIGSHYMAGDGVRPDVVADWHGLEVSQLWEQLASVARLSRSGRGRYVDEFADWGEEPEPIPDAPDLSQYSDAMATALDLVGPAEIADRAGVSRSAVSQWRKRYPKFPAPLATIGATRNAPNGGGGGTPVWNWPAVAKWLDATGRRNV